MDRQPLGDVSRSRLSRGIAVELNYRECVRACFITVPRNGNITMARTVVRACVGRASNRAVNWGHARHR